MWPFLCLPSGSWTERECFCDFQLLVADRYAVVVPWRYRDMSLIKEECALKDISFGGEDMTFGTAKDSLFVLVNDM